MKSTGFSYVLHGEPPLKVCTLKHLVCTNAGGRRRPGSGQREGVEIKPDKFGVRQKDFHTA